MTKVTGKMLKILNYLNEHSNSATKDDLVDFFEDFEETSTILVADNLTELGYVKMNDGFGRDFVITITELGKQVLSNSLNSNI